MDRNRIIRDEADRWARDGHIDPALHEWIKRTYPPGADTETQRTLQQVLLIVAGILVLVGIFTLVAEFWDRFSNAGKYNLLLAFTAVSILLGTLLSLFPRVRLLSHVLWPLAVPLYLFAMAFAQAENYEWNNNPLTLKEALSFVGGLLLTSAALVLGLRYSATLALAAPPALLANFTYLDEYQSLPRDGERAIMWIGLAVVLLLHALFLNLWHGTVRLPFSWKPFSLRLAMATNVPWGFGLIYALSFEYLDTRRLPFDNILIPIVLAAVYLGVLLAFGLRWGLPELTGLCGLFLIADAIVLGESQGGLIGSIIAIFTTAILLVVLAQQGVLGRIFKPRPPPADAGSRRPTFSSAATRAAVARRRNQP